MTIKVKYSNKYHAKMKRIRNLPKMSDDMISGMIKRDMIELKKIFHDGIKNDKFSLDRLAQITIDSKRKKGYKQPETPLYAGGDSEKDRSYSNMLIIKKVKNGWKLKPHPSKLHHSWNIKLKDLFRIHEHGAIIHRNTKDGDVLIKIPPRPALMIAYRKWLIERRKREPKPAVEVKRAISSYIEEGKMKEILNLSKWLVRE